MHAKSTKLQGLSLDQISWFFQNIALHIPLLLDQVCIYLLSFFLWSWMLRVFSRQSIYICREKKLALSMLCCPDSPRKKKLSMKVFNSSFWYSNHHELGGTLPFSHYEVNLGLFSLGFCATQQHQRINHNVLRLLLKNQTCWDVGFY